MIFTPQPTVGFIGAGKAGTALGRYFRLHGIAVSGYASRTFEHAEDAARLTESTAFPTAETLAAHSDIVMVTTDDASIASVWEQLRAHAPARMRIVCHCSGALSSEVFEGASELGLYACSCHPLFAFSRTCNLADIAQVLFAIEGHDEAVRALTALVETCGNEAIAIESSSKTAYHAAAACASNLVVALIDEAERTLVACGFTRDQAHQALSPLLVGMASSIAANGCAAALTGPLERGDLGTVEAHLRALSGNTLDVYRSLSKTLVPIAAANHPERDYSPIKALLETAELR